MQIVRELAREKKTLEQIAAGTVRQCEVQPLLVKYKDDLLAARLLRDLDVLKWNFGTSGSCVTIYRICA